MSAVPEQASGQVPVQAPLAKNLPPFQSAEAQSDPIGIVSLVAAPEVTPLAVLVQETTQEKPLPVGALALGQALQKNKEDLDRIAHEKTETLQRLETEEKNALAERSALVAALTKEQDILARVVRTHGVSMPRAQTRNLIEIEEKLKRGVETLGLQPSITRHLEKLGIKDARQLAEQGWAFLSNEAPIARSGADAIRKTLGALGVTLQP
jgi:hypothetical protein